MRWKLFFQIVVLIIVAGIVAANTWYLRIGPTKGWRFRYIDDKIYLCPRGCYEINPR